MTKTTALLILILFLTACQKKATDISRPFVVYNSMQVPLCINIYKTFSDYYNNDPVFIRDTIQAMDSLVLYNKILLDTMYFFDAYSADLKYSTWQQSVNGFQTKYNQPYNDNLSIGNLYPSQKVKVCLDGKSYTSWQAVAAFKIVNWIQQNVWQQLDSTEHFLQLRIFKSDDALLLSKDQNGNLLQQYFTNRVDDVDAFNYTSGVQLKFSTNYDSPAVYTFTNNFDSLGYGYYRTVAPTDTLIGTFGAYRYMLVKQ